MGARTSSIPDRLELYRGAVGERVLIVTLDGEVSRPESGRLLISNLRLRS
jgi:hypothetical protein